MYDNLPEGTLLFKYYQVIKNDQRFGVVGKVIRSIALIAVTLVDHVRSLVGILWPYVLMMEEHQRAGKLDGGRFQAIASHSMRFFGFCQRSSILMPIAHLGTSLTIFAVRYRLHLLLKVLLVLGINPNALYIPKSSPSRGAVVRSIFQYTIRTEATRYPGEYVMTALMRAYGGMPFVMFQEGGPVPPLFEAAASGDLKRVHLVLAQVWDFTEFYSTKAWIQGTWMDVFEYVWSEQTKGTYDVSPEQYNLVREYLTGALQKGSESCDTYRKERWFHEYLPKGFTDKYRLQYDRSYSIWYLPEVLKDMWSVV